MKFAKPHRTFTVEDERLFPGGFANGVTSGFLCAAAVSAGQITIPAYALLSLPPTGSSVAPGQLTVGNRSVTTFTASGLDVPSIAYGVGYTLSVKYH